MLSSSSIVHVYGFFISANILQIADVALRVLAVLAMFLAIIWPRSYS